MAESSDQVLTEGASVAERRYPETVMRRALIASAVVARVLTKARVDYLSFYSLGSAKYDSDELKGFREVELALEEASQRVVQEGTLAAANVFSGSGSDEEIILEIQGKAAEIALEALVVGQLRNTGASFNRVHSLRGIKAIEREGVLRYPALSGNQEIANVFVEVPKVSPNPNEPAPIKLIVVR